MSKPYEYRKLEHLRHAIFYKEGVELCWESFFKGQTNFIKRVISCLNACEGIEDPTDLRKQKDELIECLHNLAGYAETVRLDRKDNTREYALQTIEWCQGLLEQVTEVKQALARCQEKEKGL